MDEEENADIAAAMGFASFGATAKKRKFDHANSPKTKADASGANSTKLGVRTKNLSGFDEDHTGGSINGLARSPAEAQTRASAKPTNPPEPAGGSGLAGFLARGQNLPDKPTDTLNKQHSSAQSDQSAAEMLSFGGPLISKTELNALRSGIRNEKGDTAYFLPSFVEDPWEKLRKSGGVRD
ncbi:hypothetical protein BDW02DRAFT_567083 [Decorospora gaudefroyi]|uniref:Uncharacterized protein n=1 Tax=Decorospora gaudefroyi TaxID=184978 RepID=A0A6A5KJQ2_9PLEO|nr:hypothetical protein BDW02DRAFT_567083 [Decorospora gaudefroyi]